jgi:putative ABC transport system permease protein
MVDLDTWQEIAATLRKNKLRTFMTAAGVFWGMLMLVLLLGFGEGLQKAVGRSMADNATNQISMWGQRSSRPHQGRRAGVRTSFSLDDVPVLQSIPGIHVVAPRNQLGGYRSGEPVFRGAKSGAFSIMGDVPDYRDVQPMEFIEGRFIDSIDLAEKRKVAVLGWVVYEALFDAGESPIGQTIRVRGSDFVVVGLFKSPLTGDAGDRQSSILHIPLTTFHRLWSSKSEVGWFSLSGEPQVKASWIEEEARTVLMNKHAIHPEDRNAIGSWNGEEEYAKINKLFSGIRVFNWFVGVATLLSGVIGVSNIMLIVVRERTSELGLRRALGATTGSIIRLVVQEAVVLTSISGYAGLVAGVGVLQLTDAVLGDQSEVLAHPQVDFSTALWATAVLAVAGVFAGALPAYRAATIHPVAALRGG